MPRKCWRCHVLKPWHAYDYGPSGRKMRRVCRECLEAERRESMARGQGREKRTWFCAERGIWVRRCGDCKQVKALYDDFYEANRNGSPLGNARQYYCKPCAVRRTTQRHRETRRERPEETRAYYAQRQREYRRRRRKDPEYLEQVRRAARERYRRRQIEAGRPTRPSAWKEDRVHNNLGLEVPAAPLVEVLLALTNEAYSMGDVCARAGISERRLFSWRQPRARARALLADHVLTKLDLLWFDVWDPERFPGLYSPLEWIGVVDVASRAFEGVALIG